MKILVFRLIPLVMLTALAACSACAGPNAQKHVLLPAMQSAWPGVQDDIEYGLNDAFEEGQVTEAEVAEQEATMTTLGLALSEKDLNKVRSTSWTELNTWGERGIEARVEDGLSESVAASLTSRLTEFDNAMKEIQGL